jgi:hypothetical protein
MPARPSHIPHAVERTTLQKMSATAGVPLEKLHPAGKQTVAGMLAKDGSHDDLTTGADRAIA